MNISAGKCVLLVCLIGLNVAVTAAGKDWIQLNEGTTGPHDGSMLIHDPVTRQFLLIGPEQREWRGQERKGAFAQVYNAVTGSWSDFAAGPGAKPEIHPYYQTALDPDSRIIYCLSGGQTLYEFHLKERTWKLHPPAEALSGLSWQAMAFDPIGKRLVVIGSDKRIDNLGWLRTVVFDPSTGQWSRLNVDDQRVLDQHRQQLSALDAVGNLVGHIRLAWYRDPAGVGTDVERRDLLDQCTGLQQHSCLHDFTSQVKAIAALIADKQLLNALKAARSLQRQIEILAESAYPVPCSRRNAPLVFDQQHRVFVLFGGDHEDYLLNDTWLLDLQKEAWRRVTPDQSPSPRAGHALQYLPRSGLVALYEGYMASNSTDYGSRSWSPIRPVQLWLYDVESNRWNLNQTWTLPTKGDPAGPGAAGHFDGYAAEWYSPPALAVDASDQLLLVSHARDDQHPSALWSLPLDPRHVDDAGRDMLGSAPNQRLYRDVPFRADFCEVDDPPAELRLGELPENQWVKLPAAPRNPCRGCRQRDWGTSVWDPDRDQILIWGGGHCVRSASTVAHYSPASGRIVEGFDADEPYGTNGSGGFDSSLLNRPWVSAHNYKHYAYDPRCRLMVSGRGYLYDPGRMDWLRAERAELPYRFEWGSTVLATSPHGVVAWARRKTGDNAGLWLFDRTAGWTELELNLRIFVPWCDSHGMVYDSKRDRLLISSVDGGYGKSGNGTLLSIDFKTRAVEVVVPVNAELGRTNCARELAYVEHADWLLIGDHFRPGDSKGDRPLTRIYDCHANRLYLMDAGPAPDGHESGWMYDARRKLAYSFSTRGEAWAMRIVPESARLLDE